VHADYNTTRIFPEQVDYWSGAVRAVKTGVPLQVSHYVVGSIMGVFKTCVECHDEGHVVKRARKRRRLAIAAPKVGFEDIVIITVS
jgi:hypothetical protein